MDNYKVIDMLEIMITELAHNKQVRIFRLLAEIVLHCMYYLALKLLKVSIYFANIKVLCWSRLLVLQCIDWLSSYK